MPEERRRFFRIDDIVGVNSEVVEKHQLDKRLESFWNDQHKFSIRNEFNYKLEQHQADLNHIKGKMPELGRYLSVLQEQIDLLTERMLETDKSIPSEEKPVNLSAQGISFFADERVAIGDIIELNLKLLPGQQEIVTFAKVINCSPARSSEQKKFKISLDFEHIHEADRELLVKHVHGKQLKSLGATRFEEND
ncbi:MAG: PilZ domain-containing protein [Gammaproteobacteria bacterium]|nr:PilZ domain-containing protein [Gammaproteobacteria bacterium]MBL7000087.1 PilZ domain-containing protein [Gammaproteobacteria bacterium]